jgi:FkbM family methyltransferase
MTFISYAQNNEDVLLWRALGHVRDGFYIDVGANDPVEHSVTKAFYDAGWRGINIEPLPAHIEAFARQRPRDTNLALAAGASDGSLTLYDVPAVRGWASPQREVADLHRAEGHAVAELTVPVRTLAAICAEHVTGEIQFLKIDVEGFEEQVLRGMDFRRWRPWVLVIEATLPNSRVTNHASWEHLVTGQDYRFAWFDGLNRYYVAAEHAALLEALNVQPNVFDDAIPYHLDKAWAGLRDAEHAREAAERARAAAEQARAETEQARAAAEQARAAAEQSRAETERARAAAEQAAQQEQAAAERRLQAAGQEIAALHGMLASSRADVQHAASRLAGLQQVLEANAAWASDLERRLLDTQGSLSWKLTRPLRGAAGLARALRRPHLARRVVTRLTHNEPIRRLVIPVLLRYPALGRRVSHSLAAIKLAAPAQTPDGAAVPNELKQLPLSVRAVLADLERARGNAREPQH